MLRKAILGATILVAILAFAGSTNVAAQSNAKQIRFSVRGGTIQWVVIVGTNQNGRDVRWQWADAYYQNWSTGAYVVQTDGWWWQGYVRLGFNITDLGTRHCAIDNLEISPYGNYTDVIYDPDTDSCSGDAGSAGTPYSVKMLLSYYLGERDGEAIVDAADGAYDVQECVKAIAEGVAGGRSRFSVGWQCRGAAADVIQAILRRHNKSIEFR